MVELKISEIDNIEGEIERQKEHIYCKTHNFTVHYLESELNKKTFIFDSGKEDSSWPDRKESGFIEAMLLGMPMLPIIIITTGLISSTVLDGYFRLKAIERYLDDKLLLTGLNKLTLLNGLRFSNLKGSRRKKFRATVIPVIILDLSSVPSPEIIYNQEKYKDILGCYRDDK